MIFDLALLVLFCIFVYIFIKTRKHNLKKEGWMYLYKTSWGMERIEKTSKKYSKILHALQYPIILVGIVLMVSMTFLLIQTIYIYIRFPQITEVIKAPPVMPLIPYFPQIFGVESLLPPFYFTYFIVALIVVAVVHEFAHGIYMRLYGVKIKSTGFAFLGPILGAFVEQDEKSLISKKKRQQMTILAAGVFANMVFALIFFLLLVGFFYSAYEPAGYKFNDYAYEVVPLSNITLIGNQTENNLTNVYVGNYSYLYSGNASYLQKAMNSAEKQAVVLYFDAPAIKNSLKGAIVQIDSVEIKNRESLSEFLQGKNPGDNITVKTSFNNSITETKLTLVGNPINTSKPFLGVVSQHPAAGRGIFGKLLSYMTNFRDSSTYYVEKRAPITTIYIYNFLWWIMMINLFVGLFNMLPLGILDGGRFFYLGVAGLMERFGVEKKKADLIGKKSFKVLTLIIGLIFVAMIFSWLIAL